MFLGETTSLGSRAFWHSGTRVTSGLWRRGNSGSPADLRSMVWSKSVPSPWLARTLARAISSPPRGVIRASFAVVVRRISDHAKYCGLMEMKILGITQEGECRSWQPPLVSSGLRKRIR